MSDFMIILFSLAKHLGYVEQNPVACWLHTDNRRICFDQGCGSGSGGSGPFSVEVEAEARKSYRFRFHIGYLTWRSTWRKSFVHFSMWISAVKLHYESE